MTRAYVSLFTAGWLATVTVFHATGLTSERRSGEARTTSTQADMFSYVIAEYTDVRSDGESYPSDPAWIFRDSLLRRLGETGADRIGITTSEKAENIHCTRCDVLKLVERRQEQVRRMRIELRIMSGDPLSDERHREITERGDCGLGLGLDLCRSKILGKLARRMHVHDRDEH